MHNDIEKILFSKEEVHEMVKKIGKQISDDYRNSDKRLLLVCILKGSLIFTSDLMREIDIPCEVDFMQASSYGDKTISNGTVHIRLDLKEQDLSKYNIVIIEDILDTGNTLYNLINVLHGKGCDDVKLCVLLNKPDRRERPITVHYEGAKIPDEFVVGYGLDYDDLYRNLPYIGVLKPQVYEK
ncbi:MAG: hypoxanthine phosphoribosyltransferase [Acutalibacteraceae bacterium]